MRNNPEIINGIPEMNPTCILLANNHILDFSEIGLKDTTRILDINWIGVGENKNKLKKFFVIDNKVGIYNCCESEFSNVTETTEGRV